MSVQIFDYTFGINRCYVIRDKGAIMIDGGSPNAGRKFLKKMKSYSLDTEEIQLIVLTHVDFDHVGSAKEIKEITGAKIAIHENDRMNLEQGIFNWPKGVTPWGRISHGLFFPM